MDWKNVDLSSDYERSQDILSSYSFDTLLLEISCNIKDITKESIRVQFETELKNKMIEACEIFEANLNNILKDALKYRNMA